MYGEYKKEAIAAFEQFHSSNETELLRTDLINASACLEHADLLDAYKDKDEICNLLRKAAESAGTHNDVKQLCAIGFLKIGEFEEAKKYLRILVSEQFNTIPNAQILSGIYCREWIENKDVKALELNTMLEHFVAPEYLYDLPSDDELGLSSEEGGKELIANDTNDKFLTKQRGVLSAKYELVINKLIAKFSIQLNRIFQTPDPKRNYVDEYFLDSNSVSRRKDIENTFMNPRRRKAFNKNISAFSLRGEYVDALNSFANAMSYLTKLNIDTIDNLLEAPFLELSDTLELLQISIDDERFTMDNYETLSKHNFSNLVATYKEQYLKLCEELVKNCTSLKDISDAENELRIVCNLENINSPESLYEQSRHPVCNQRLTKVLTTNKIIGDDIEWEKKQSMSEVCYNNSEAINKIGSYRFITVGNGDIKNFYILNKDRIRDRDKDNQLLTDFQKRRVIAILSSGKKSLKYCIFLTPDNVYYIDYGKVKVKPYSEITSQKVIEDMTESDYAEALFTLIEDLKDSLS